MSNINNLTRIILNMLLIALVLSIFYIGYGFYLNPKLPTLDFTEKEFDPLSQHNPDCFRAGVHTDLFKKVVLRCPENLILKYKE